MKHKYQNTFELCTLAQYRLEGWINQSSQTEVARHLGFSRQALNNLLRRGLSARMATRILSAAKLEVRHE